MRKPLIVALVLGVGLVPWAQASRRTPQWTLTKVEVLGEVDPSGATSGQITVYGATAGYTDKTNKKVYPSFIASKSAIKACSIYVDFSCNVTTKLGWLVGVSGPICTSVFSPNLVPVTKDKIYRFEMTLQGDDLSILIPGLYDVCVTVAPNLGGPSPSLNGNGGMSTAFARMKLNS